MLAIDGSFGEGGGQVLRSAVTLSIVTGRPIKVDNVRVGRRKPGLRRQHLTAVKAAAEAEGIDKVFREAGFDWQEAGCAMCFHAGGETFPEGARVMSSTNRNFEGRQGPGVRTHIASPEAVAWSAVRGQIADVREAVLVEHA